MHKNELDGTELKRPTVLETEKIRDLAKAPVKAETAVDHKEKLAEAKESITQRLERQKEAKAVDEAQPGKPEKEREMADVEEELNKGSYSPSFGTSQGVCRSSQTPQNYCIFAGF